MKTLCINCLYLNGCETLQQKGELIPERVSTEDNYWVCPDWEYVGDRESQTRRKVYECCGLGAVRGINRLHQIVLEDVDEMNETEDFGAILKEGMTTAERELQLRYRTYENGDLELDEKGNPIPRAVCALKHYAADPNGPVNESLRKVIFWEQDPLIKVILRAEVKAGMITRAGKTQETEPADEPEHSEEEEMVAPKRTRKISMKGGIKGLKSKGSKVPAKAGGAAAMRKPAVGGKSLPQAEEEEDTEVRETQQVNLSSIKEELSGDIKKYVDKQLKAAVNELRTALEYNQQFICEHVDQRVTILHDIMLQAMVTVAEDIVWKIFYTDEEGCEPRLDEDGNDLSFDLEESLLTQNDLTIAKYDEVAEEEEGE